MEKIHKNVNSGLFYFLVLLVLVNILTVTVNSNHVVKAYTIFLNDKFTGKMEVTTLLSNTLLCDHSNKKINITS